jgi:hypothetical protein
MAWTDDDYRTILQEIDAMGAEVSAWEAAFIESILAQAQPLTQKQKDVIDRMRERYLPF